MSRGPHRRWREHDLSARTRLFEVAAAQGGVLAPADAFAHDVDQTTFARLVDAGVLRRIRYGVYADAAVIDRTVGDREAEHLLAAAAVIRTLPATAALTHVSGVLAWDGPLPYSALPAAVQIWRPPGQDHRGGHDARSTVFALQEGDLVHRHGVLVVPAAVAAAHACFTLPEAWAVAACDHMVHRRHTTTDELHEAADLLESVPGHGRIGRLVRMSRPGAESPHESLSRVAFRRAGLPEPQLQVPIYDDLGLIGYVDFLLEGWGVVGESDGLLKYGSGDGAVLIAEKLREDRLRALGYEVVRWTWDELMHHPERIVRRILGAAARSRPAHRAAARLMAGPGATGISSGLRAPPRALTPWMIRGSGSSPRTGAGADRRGRADGRRRGGRLRAWNRTTAAGAARLAWARPGCQARARPAAEAASEGTP